MDHEPSETRAYARHLYNEHRRLHQLLSRVQQSWPPGESAQDDPVLVARLSTAIEELRAELEKHFAEEDSGGVLEEAVARVPRLGAEETRLQNEHPQLLAELDEIRAEILSAADRGTVSAPAKQQFERFVGKIHAHEAAENRILAQGFHIEMEAD